MSHEFKTLDAALNHDFDTVIDVRSPSEFAEDHIPGAVSLPVLSDEERARVGTLYKQVSPFDARKLGAALVARNAARHIEGPLSGYDGSWQPLVYCWRGGQRSGSFASILSQIGWRTELVAGGYKSWRKLVQTRLYERELGLQIILLDGNTGTAKTALLARLQARGYQMIDLEGLAAHRGSLLGGQPGGQPSQKGFETLLATELAKLDPARPVLVEAESSKIGNLSLPPSLWKVMAAAPRIVIEAPITARATYLADAYADIIADPALLQQRLNVLIRHRGHEVVAGWTSLLEQHNFHGLAAALIEQHYDPAYAKARAAKQRPELGRISAQTLDDAGLSQLTDAACALLSAG